MELFDLLLNGGIFVPVVLLVGFLSVVFGGLTTLITGFIPWRIPSSFAWLGLTLTLLIGCLGTIQGLNDGSAAVAVASEEMRGMLAAAASGMALIPMTVSDLVASLGFLLVSICASVTAVVAPGPKAVRDSAGMIRAGLGALLGVVAAVLGLVTMIDFASAQSMLLPLISIVLISTLGTLSVLLASTRLSSTDRSRKAMMAGMRGFILISSACAIIFFAASCARLYRIEEMMAIANAPESIRASLVARAQALASCCSRVGLCCLLPPTFAGLMSLSSVFGYADSRVSFGALLGGIQLVVIGGCYFWVSRSLASLVLVIG